MQAEQKIMGATQTTVQLAAEACARHAEQSAFTCLGAKLSFTALDALSSAFAKWLLRQGLQSGDRVALLLPNLLQYPVAALGVLKAGGIVVNMNPLYTAHELEHLLNDAGVRILVVSAHTAHVVARVIAATPVERVVVTDIGDLHPWYRRLPLNFIVRHVRRLVPPFAFPAQTGFRQALAEGRSASPQQLPQDLHPDAVAVLQYTGDTTGRAKGAMLSQRNLVANMQQVAVALAGCLPPSGSVMVAPLPLYHIYALTLNFLTSTAHGHHTLLIPDSRDIPAFVRALKPWRINGIAGISTLYKALCSNAAFRALDFSGLTISSSGGMALEPQVAQRWRELTGSKAMEGYGLSECSPLVTCFRPAALRAGTVGKPAPGTSVVIKDRNGHVLPPGVPGEVCVKGPQVMLGYWRQPEETASVFDADGWLHSGDIGVLDEDGFLKIVDRIKDLIIISGFNVYPNEIEEHVCAHPEIVEAAAVGIRDEFAPRVTLFVVRRNQRLTEEQILAWCREGLAPYKVPRAVEFLDTLPKSTVGKVLRRELRMTLGEKS